MFIIFLIVACCLSETISDLIVRLVRRLRMPRPHVYRVRQYRFD